MSDPVRLFEGSDSALERQLLGVARAEKSSPEARAKTLAALGITGSAALSATAVGAVATRASIAAGKTVWAKLVLGLSVAGVVAIAPPVYRAWQRHQAAARARGRATPPATSETQRRRPTSAGTRPPPWRASWRRSTPRAPRSLTSSRDARSRCSTPTRAPTPTARLGPEAEILRIDALAQGGQRRGRAPPRRGVRSPPSEQRPRGARAPVPRRLSARCAGAATTRDRDAGPRVGHVCARAFLVRAGAGPDRVVPDHGRSHRVQQRRRPAAGAADRTVVAVPEPVSRPGPHRRRDHHEDQHRLHAALPRHPTDQPIYLPDRRAPTAYIQDVFHNDMRTEGIGLGMLIAVELDHRDELDSLWTYAKSALRVTTGSNSGYFNSFCENAGRVTIPCLDPFGLQQMTMALILAHDRYTLADAPATARSTTRADARDLLTLMRHKVDQNGGVVDGVTDTFDPATNLVLDIPNTSAAGVGRPSIEMPGYYDLWAQATGDPFWTAAAKAARDYWRRTANPTTGLTPVRATFAGVPVTGSDDVPVRGLPRADRHGAGSDLDRRRRLEPGRDRPPARVLHQPGPDATACRSPSTGRPCSTPATTRRWWPPTASAPRLPRPRRNARPSSTRSGTCRFRAGSEPLLRRAALPGRAAGAGRPNAGPLKIAAPAV